MVLPRQMRNRRALVVLPKTLVVVPAQLEPVAAASLPFRPPEYHALRFATGQSLFGAAADKVPFDFRGQSECERKYLALNIVTEPVIIFDRPYPAPFVHTHV